MVPIRISLPIIGLHLLAAFTWILALRSSQRELADEPSSYFFNPKSDHFEQQRRARLDEIKTQTKDFKTEPQNHPTESSSIQRWPKNLCLGVVSDPELPDRSPKSLLTTLSSLTVGLTADERDSIHMVVLLATDRPERHFAYKEPWLPKMADEVIEYGDINTAGTRLNGFRVVALDEDDTPRGGFGRDARSRFDQVTLMEACAATDTFYTALVEPDFVATADWHARFVQAVAHVDRTARLSSRDWAFLRLFHDVEPGWRMHAGMLVLWSLSWMVAYLTVVVTGVSLYSWGFHGKGLSPKAVWQASFPLLTLVVWVPVAVWLFLQIGGGAALQHHNAGYVAGVRELGDGSRLGHGMVFPKRHLSEFETALRRQPYEAPASQMLDTLAKQMGWWRWGLDPSVVV